ncbi:unnamed protein product [Diabrotica balteata]|uniref:Uncharacterized protein n=1 Tax=Diabrotica balteata TaxID=107213 RepID=A0A9N9XI70_DIABA|nr:unnamed protein product [Diabrotica balteata]
MCDRPNYIFNMKKLIMFVIAVFVVVLADTTKEQKRKKEMDNLGEYLNTCQHDFGLLPGYILTKGYKNVKKEDEKYVGAIMLCVYRKVGLMSENGDLIEDRVHSFYINLRGDSRRSKENIKKILTICTPPINDTPQYKAFFYESCLDKHKLTR